jgi:hypothetical protein
MAGRLPYGDGVQTLTAYVDRDPAHCWRVFIDAALWPLWVPGLRRAQVIAMERGLPAEVHFEYADSLAYTLVYAYDVERREVRWEPKLGKREGVRGFARFEPIDRGARMTYGLEHGEGRTERERALGDPEALVAAFVRWMAAER